MFKGQLDGYFWYSFNIFDSSFPPQITAETLARLHQDEMCRMFFKTAAQSNKNLEVKQMIVKMWQNKNKSSLWF